MATGLCLTLKPGWYLVTETCDENNRYQLWQQWNRGFLENTFDNACVTRTTGATVGPTVRAFECNFHGLEQYWLHSAT